VSVLIIRFSLLLLLGAVASFLLAIALDQLAATNFAEQAAQFGSMVLICAFSLLLLTGFGLLAKLIVASFCDYFSTRQRLERRLLFYTGNRNRLNRLFYFKKVRLLYISQQKRKQLLKKHGRTSVTS
jgi:hypothetical protein